MKKNWKILEIIIFTAVMPFTINAQNPIIQNIYTADPAPLVFNNTLYLYTGHDEDSAPDDRFVMRNYQCFSTTDMVNWTQHGNILQADSVFKWCGGDANAAQCIYRNSKFYYYISVHDKTHPGVALGVAVSDNPLGPFKDALGHALVTNDMTTYAHHSWDDLDPTVFIDDNGQAYLYWGNNACYYAKLNDDMVSLNGGIFYVPLTTETFGPDYEEAPWLFKRKGIYYMLYASKIPEAICYSISKSPMGPWTYGGTVMNAMEQGCASNHPGVIDYKGNSYFFYHNAALPRGVDKRRSICVAQFEYNADGSIPTINHSTSGIRNGLTTLDPNIRTEAETMAFESGIEIEKSSETSVYVTYINNGDYIKVRNVDFSKEIKSFKAGVASASAGGNIEIRLDSLNGTLLGTCIVRNTGGWESWDEQLCAVNKAKGIHDVYFVFKGGESDLFNFNWWKFNDE